jgi:hypothetical protein
MKLNIPDRITLLNILPNEGNVVTLRLIMDFQRQVGFTGKEIKDWKIANKVDGRGRPYVVWDSDFTEATKDIQIGDAMSGIIVNQLKNLDRNGKLSIDMMSLYDRFVDGKLKTSKKQV